VKDLELLVDDIVSVSRNATSAPGGLGTDKEDTLITLPDGRRIRLVDFVLANLDASMFLYDDYRDEY